MRMLGFSVYDRKVEAFLPIFFARSKGEALRSLGDAATDPNHQFAKHAADYILYQVCVFDDQTGHVDRVHEIIISVHELVDKFDPAHPAPYTADLSQASALTVNELRKTKAL